MPPDHTRCGAISGFHGPLKLLAVDLDQGHHRLRGLGLIGTRDQVDQQPGVDLPPHAEVIGDPAAGDRSSPRRDGLVPYSSTSCCVSQRTLIEKPWLNANRGPPFRAMNARSLSVNSAVTTRPVLKGDCGAEVGVPGDTRDLRVGEDRCVEANSVFFLLVVECQKYGDLMY